MGLLNHDKWLQRQQKYKGQLMEPQVLAALIRWVAARIEIRIRPSILTAREAELALRDLLVKSGLSEEDIKEWF